MITIFTRPQLLPSARSLREFLMRSVRETVIVTTRSERVGDSSVIRWGNSSGDFRGDLQLNPSGVISLCSNKVALQRSLVESSVPTVEFSKGRPDTYPVVVRKTLTGMGGAGIVVCKNEEEFLPYSGLWWSPWYSFKYELGVHVVGDSVSKVFRKESSEPEGEEFPIRNAHRGYSFKRVSLENFPRLLPSVRLFMDVIRPKFGRLDIGWDSVNRVYRVIEFNSAPGISENSDTLNSYGNFILGELSGAR